MLFQHSLKFIPHRIRSQKAKRPFTETKVKDIMEEKKRSKEPLLGKNKLFKLKPWLNIPATAKYLSNLFEEEVSEADVLQFGLDGHLKLSVLFVNDVTAIKGGKIINYGRWKNGFEDNVTWEDFKGIVAVDGTLTLFLEKYDFYHSVMVGNREEIRAACQAKQWEPLTLGRDQRESTTRDFSQFFRERAEFIAAKGEEMKKDFFTKMAPEQRELMIHGFSELIRIRAALAGGCGQVPPDSASFFGNVRSIRGVWDLPLIDGERLFVEEEYRLLAGGPERDPATFTDNGTFVEGPDHAIWLLQERYDENYLQQTEQKRGSERRYHDPSNYFPADRLPNDSILVVRTSALNDFCHRIAEEQNDEYATDTLLPSERKSLVKLVFAMAVDAYGYDPDDNKSPVTKDLSDAVARADLSISDDTIRKWLKEGAKLRSDTY